MKKAASEMGALALVLMPVAVTPGLTSGNVTRLRVNAAILKNAYTKKTLTAVAGRVTITFDNTGFSPHNIALRAGTRASSKVIAKGPIAIHGATSRISLTLKKGAYRFFCSVERHEADGMWGIVTVR